METEVSEQIDKPKKGKNMKKLIIVLIILYCATGIVFAADPVEGYWLSIDEKTQEVTGAWQVYQEGGKLYGKLVSSAKEPPDVIADKCKESYAGFPVPGKVNQMKVVGTSWIFGLTIDKTGEWSGGNIIDPTDGKMYKCKIIFRSAGHKAGRTEYKSDMLEMRGEIGLGIGRSQFWQKTDAETAITLYERSKK